MAEQQADPLQILLAGMQQTADAFSTDAQQKIQQTNLEAQQNQPQQTAALSANQSNIDDTLNVIVPNKAAVIAAFPKASSSRIITFGRTKIATQDDGTQVAYNEPAASAAKVNTDAYAGARAILDASSAPQDGRNFDPETEFQKLKSLSGDQLDEGLRKVGIGLNVALSQAHQRISKQAMLKSGALQAQLALEENIRMDQASGFTQKTGMQFSAQTQEAQNTLQQALAASGAMLQTMIKDDPDVAKLLFYSKDLEKVEFKRAQSDERDAAKRAELTAGITQSELINYKLLQGGGSGDDDADRRAIIDVRKNNKPLAKTLQANTTNIFELLTDSDGTVRKGALKLVLEYDKANNPNLVEKDATATPMTRLLQKYIDDPVLLIKEAPGVDADTKKKLMESLMRGGTKEHEEIRRAQLSSFMQRVVEGGKENFFRNNVASWNASETTADTPLGKTIAKIKAGNKDGQAPLNDVVDNFISNPITAPDGTDMPFNQRIDMLMNGLSAASKNQYRSIVFDNPEAVQLKIGEEIKNRAARAYAAKKTSDAYHAYFGRESK